MISFPNAKINLGLNIVAKRDDDYHDIETVFYPVAWCDILEIVKGEKRINRKSEVQFKMTGSKIVGSNRNNLCIQAYQLLKEKHDLPPVQMHLHKIIPVGSGLGGGSSDAASALMLMNQIFNLELSQNEIERLASVLGADCAFFVRNKPVFASGKGNQFEDIALNLSDYFITIIKPDVYIKTESAYKNVIPQKPETSIKKIMSLPISEWKENLVNDFEKTIFKKHPGIQEIKDELYNSGAIYASMSGSGSAVYGIFSEEVNLKSKFNEYAVWSGKLA